MTVQAVQDRFPNYARAQVAQQRSLAVADAEKRYG